MSDMAIFHQSRHNLFQVNCEVCIRWYFAGERLRFEAVLPNCHSIVRSRTVAKTPKDKRSFASDKTLALHRRDTVIDRLIQLKNDLDVIYGRTVRSINSPRDVKYVIVSTANGEVGRCKYAAKQNGRPYCAYAEHAK